MGSAPARTKPWYLKNPDIFRHLRNKTLGMIDQVAVMREVTKGTRLYPREGPKASSPRADAAVDFRGLLRALRASAPPRESKTQPLRPTSYDLSKKGSTASQDEHPDHNQSCARSWSIG